MLQQGSAAMHAVHAQTLLPCMGAGVQTTSLIRVAPLRRYDPYGRVLTRERYDQGGMRAVRRAAVEAARAAEGSWGLVLGTLGRQGNPRILRHLQGLLAKRGVLYTNVRTARLLLPADPEQPCGCN